MTDDWVRVDELNPEGEDPTLIRDLANDYVHHGLINGEFQYQRGWSQPVPLGTIQSRWCPAHTRWEQAPKGERLRCGAAWAELYEIEKEIEAEKMSPNRAILALVESMSSLVEEVQNGERVIAEPPPKPQAPRPSNPMPPSSRNNGKGGVVLP
tara:strand:+ start:592 stop:1050 length:459 start_codon:yes stop_codon:yes gene_type:complete